MDDKVTKLKKNFEGQLEQVSKQIDGTRAQLDNLLAMREQLKGAIFALNAVSAGAEPAPEAKPAEVPVEAPPVVEAPAAEQKDEG